MRAQQAVVISVGRLNKTHSSTSTNGRNPAMVVFCNRGDRREERLEGTLSNIVKTVQRDVGPCSR